MDARLLGPAILAATLCTLDVSSALAAQVRTPNFVVEAPTQEFAQEVAQAAEVYRHDLAVHWLGAPLPKNWKRPCPIKVRVGKNLGAGGVTSFLFDGGHVFGWDMNIQGTRERVLDSVLPHEVTHTIFASHFRQPLPRWADEGACTTVEHQSERSKHKQMLLEFLRNSRGIAFSQMFMMTEYPDDVLPLYSQGHSLVTFLLQRGGPRRFVTFMDSGLEHDRWIEAVREHYRFPTLAALQDEWLDWVKAGSPAPAVSEEDADRATGESLASDQRPRPEPDLVYRGQSQDEASRPEELVRVQPVRQRAPRPERPIETPERDRQPRSESNEASGEPGWQGIAAPLPGPADEPEAAASARMADDRRRGPDEEETAASRARRDPRPSRKPRRVILEWSREPAPDDGTEDDRLEDAEAQPIQDASLSGRSRWR